MPNGKLYIQRNVTPPVYIVHLYGTAYEMGYAQGQLFKDIGPKFWPSVHQPRPASPCSASLCHFNVINNNIIYFPFFVTMWAHTLMSAFMV